MWPYSCRTVARLFPSGLMLSGPAPLLRALQRLPHGITGLRGQRRRAHSGSAAQCKPARPSGRSASYLLETHETLSKNPKTNPSPQAFPPQIGRRRGRGGCGKRVIAALVTQAGPVGKSRKARSGIRRQTKPDCRREKVCQCDVSEGLHILQQLEQCLQADG